MQFVAVKYAERHTEWNSSGFHADDIARITSTCIEKTKARDVLFPIFIEPSEICKSVERYNLPNASFRKNRAVKIYMRM